jgi:hypothetical protein
MIDALHDLQSDMVEWRRDIHAHPEVAFEERRTANLVAEKLTQSQRRDVRWMVLREGVVLGAMGGALGLAAAIAFTRLLTRFLFGVTATDPMSFVLAAALLVMVVPAACLLPARRAARIDPSLALRAE